MGAVYRTLDKKEFSNAGVAKAGFCGVSRTQNAYFPHASAAYSLLRTCSVKTSLPMTAPTIEAFSSQARQSCFLNFCAALESHCPAQREK
jgi:hypothetical protein